MKITIEIFILSGLMICAMTGRAQRAQLYQKKIDHFRVQKTAGAIMIMTSVPTATLGTYWIIHGGRRLDNSERYSDEWSNFFNGMFELIAGCVLVVVGTGLLAGGTVMHVIGNSKIKQYQEKLEGLKVGLYCTPKQAGLTFTYRF